MNEVIGSRDFVYNIEFTSFKNEKHACSLGKISVFKDEVLNDTIGDEVLGWFEETIEKSQECNELLLQQI